jgi:hypothetical protein
MSKTPRHPAQPLVTAPDGVRRFKANELVRRMLAEVGGLSVVDRWEATREDRAQLAMLTGATLRGFGSLTYVSDDDFLIAQEDRDGSLAYLRERNARLEKELLTIREGMRESVALLYGVEPDSLGEEPCGHNYDE